jgi:hypothetical protein
MVRVKQLGFWMKYAFGLSLLFGFTSAYPQSTIPAGTIVGYNGCRGSPAAPQAITGLCLLGISSSTLTGSFSMNEMQFTDTNSVTVNSYDLNVLDLIGGGGGTASGQKIALAGQAIMNGTNAGSFNVVGVLGVAQAAINQVGSQGIYAMNPTCVVNASITINTEVCMEADLGNGTSSSVAYEFGVGSARTNAQTHGTSDEAAYAVYQGSGSADGWLAGLEFTNFGGGAPISSSGTLIKTKGTDTVTSFLDFSSYTCSGGKEINFTGFTVDCSGNAGAATYAIGSTKIIFLPNSSNTNFAAGVSAMAAADTGTNNTAVGNNALNSNTSGSGITAIGNGALGAVSTGSNNTSIGGSACATISTNGNNTCVGLNSGLSATGSGLSLFGTSAGQTLTSGGYNTLIGDSAGSSITQGATNTVVGFNVASSTLTTGGSNILIGTSSAVTTVAASTSNEINIGGALIGFNVAPTLTSGWGISPTNPTQPSTFAFSFRTTLTPTTTGVIGLSTAPTGWICSANDQTSAVTARQSANTTSSVTFTWSSAPSASDVIQVRCNAY